MSIGLLTALCAACTGGNVYFRAGRKAEFRKDYDSALVDFEKALQSQPDNPLFQIHAHSARIEASIFHRKQGDRLLKDGRPDEAAGEYQKAVGIDPTNQAAAQSLTRLMEREAAEKQKREQELKQAMKPPEQTTPEIMRLKPLSQEAMGHVRISGDSKKVFETLGKLGDLNVAFVADFRPQPVSLDLVNIKIEDALHVLAYETRTFWKVVTPNTILVIPDNQTMHHEFDDRVLKTIYLTNPLQPADRTQLLSAVKQILLLQQVVDNPDANAIIVSGTPTQVEAAERMIHDLDHGKAEVLIEVAIMEADRDRIRDLGLAPVPLSNSSAQLGIAFNPPTTSTVTTGGTTTSIQTLGLNQLGHISTSDFSVVLPGAVANALLNDTRTHILQNPEIRTTDGQKAELKIGSQVPYATGSFLPSFGGAATTGTTGLGLLSTTQFQYKDVGVNLTITPHVLPDGEVSIHAKVEILAVGPAVLIGGLNQPTFTQRTIEHDIRMKEGEVNLLGGLIQSTITHAVEGLPGLSDIPILRYFFSTEHSERSEQEILVMLTPHIVRLPEFPTSAQVGIGTAGGASGVGPILNQPPGLPPQPGVPQ